MFLPTDGQRFKSLEDVDREMALGERMMLEVESNPLKKGTMGEFMRTPRKALTVATAVLIEVVYRMQSI